MSIIMAENQVASPYDQVGWLEIEVSELRVAVSALANALHDINNDIGEEEHVKPRIAKIERLMDKYSD